MTFSKTTLLPAALGAAALTLTLALGGCGQTESAPETTDVAIEETADDATDDQAEDATTETEDFSVVEDLTALSDVTRSIITSEEAVDAEGFDELATAEDEALELEDSEIEEGDGDESKAASGELFVQDGGVQMILPPTWDVVNNADGLRFESPDGAVVGFLYGTLKDSGYTYDIEGTVKAIPAQIAAQNGLTDVRILGYDTLYSDRGTLVSARVMFMGKFKNTDIVHYAQVIESKSFITGVEFISTYDGFAAHVAEIDAATNSICFLPGETI